MAALIKRIMLLLMLSLLLSACSLLAPVKLENVNSYVVNAVPNTPKKYSMRYKTIMVAQPDASGPFNTTQMAYTTERYQMAYFAKNRWVDTPPQMLQPLIVQTLQNTHYFAAVGTIKSGGCYQYALYTQLLNFEQVFQGRSSSMHIALRAQLVRNSDHRVMATKEFAVIEPSPENSPYGGVIAANRGVAKILAQLAKFVLP